MHRRNFLAAAAGSVALTAFYRTHLSASPGFGEDGPMDVASFHRSRRFAETPYGRIAYVERGRGAAALFLHGLPLNGYQWRGSLDRLSAIRRCIAPDFMGLGYSEIAAAQDLSPVAQMGMLVALLDTLKVDTVDLVASDSGGAVAQLLVALHPTRVRTLMLTNCDVHEDSPPPVLKPVIAASRAGTFADDVLLPQVRDKQTVHSSFGLGTCCFTFPLRLRDDTIDCYLAPLVSSPLRKAQLHQYCIALEHNPLLGIEAALRRSEVPMRVVWGTGDTLFDPKSPEWLDRTFPNSRGIRRIEGARLFWQEEYPEVIAEECRRLWA